ncbi:MAG: hypothetical protein LUP95_05670 [Euryarchaeota archaeon]|nr:hypothetical protein [Euryarchaeota archaeon]
MSTVIRDESIGAAAARLLHHKFTSTGIFGRNSNTEDSLLKGMERGPLEHLLFLTLAVSIDY